MVDCRKPCVELPRGKLGKVECHGDKLSHDFSGVVRVPHPRLFGEHRSHLRQLQPAELREVCKDAGDVLGGGQKCAGLDVDAAVGEQPPVAPQQAVGVVLVGFRVGASDQQQMVGRLGGERPDVVGEFQQPQRRKHNAFPVGHPRSGDGQVEVSLNDSPHDPWRCKNRLGHCGPQRLLNREHA